MKKRTIIIIAIIVVLLVILAVGVYFYLNAQGFSFSTFDFSSGARLYDALGKSGNVFAETKINPFSNSS